MARVPTFLVCNPLSITDLSHFLPVRHPPPAIIVFVFSVVLDASIAKDSNVELPAAAAKETNLLLSAEKVAELLDISIRSLWRLRASRQIPAPIRVGGSVRWRTKDLEAWIAKGCPTRN